MGRLGELTPYEIKQRASKYMCLLDVMPDVQQFRMYRMLFAFHIAAWARKNVFEANLCVKLANGTIDENNDGVLSCVERVTNTIPGFRRFERELVEHMKWQPAFAMCATALFLSVWRAEFSDKYIDDTQQTQQTVANFCSRLGFSIEEYDSNFD